MVAVRICIARILALNEGIKTNSDLRSGNKNSNNNDSGNGNKGRLGETKKVNLNSTSAPSPGRLVAVPLTWWWEWISPFFDDDNCLPSLGTNRRQQLVAFAAAGGGVVSASWRSWKQY